MIITIKDNNVSKELKQYTFSIRSSGSELYEIKLSKLESFSNIYEYHNNASRLSTSRKFVLVSINSDAANPQIIMKSSTPADIKARSKKVNLIEIIEMDSSDRLLKVQEFILSNEGPVFEQKIKIIKLANSHKFLKNSTLVSEQQLTDDDDVFEHSNSTLGQFVVDLVEPKDGAMRLIHSSPKKRPEESDAVVPMTKKPKKITESEIETKEARIEDSIQHSGHGIGSVTDDQSDQHSESEKSDRHRTISIKEEPTSEAHEPTSSELPKAKVEPHKAVQEDASSSSSIKKSPSMEDLLNERALSQFTSPRSAPNSKPIPSESQPREKDAASPQLSNTSPVTQPTNGSYSSPKESNPQTAPVPLNASTFQSLQRSPQSASQFTRVIALNKEHPSATSTPKPFSSKYAEFLMNKISKQEPFIKSSPTTINSPSDIECAKNVERIIDHTRRGGGFNLRVVLNDQSEKSLQLSLLKKYKPELIQLYSDVKNLGNLLF